MPPQMPPETGIEIDKVILLVGSCAVIKAATNINQWSAHDIYVLKPHKCISETNISNLYGKYCDFITNIK